MQIGYARGSTEDQNLALKHYARPSRIGYSLKALTNPTGCRLAEIHRFLKCHLDADRTNDQSSQMRKAGFPL